jgi:hypothetical protein
MEKDDPIYAAIDRIREKRQAELRDRIRAVSKRASMGRSAPPPTRSPDIAELMAQYEAAKKQKEALEIKILNAKKKKELDDLLDLESELKGSPDDDPLPWEDEKPKGTPLSEAPDTYGEW